MKINMNKEKQTLNFKLAHLEVLHCSLTLTGLEGKDTFHLFPGLHSVEESMRRFLFLQLLSQASIFLILLLAFLPFRGDFSLLETVSGGQSDPGCYTLSA